MNKKICIIISNYYPKISKELVKSALAKLKKEKFLNIKTVYVPGTFEIPVVLANLIAKYDAFVVLGCVIRGQTKHFDFLCNSVFQSIVRLSIEHKIPISNGILTCENMKQAILRANPKKGNKGGYAAEATVSILKTIS